MNWQPLIDAARAARRRAYAPYSGYQVGAALLVADGSIHAAGNVENGLPALSICAERLAMAAAVNAGHKELRALVVATESSPPAYPCGLCRQTLVELTRELPVLLVNEDGERVETSLGVLLPSPFLFDEAKRC